MDNNLASCIEVVAPELTRIIPRFFLLLSAIIIVSFVACPRLVDSQSESLQLNTTFEDLQNAQSAGAKPSEMQPLISQMNSIVDLETQLQNLPLQDSPRGAQLREQINNTLKSVDMQAIQLETIASQRSRIDHIVAYSSGIVCAIVCTAAYHYGILLYKRYRRKRTFRMTISRK